VLVGFIFVVGARSQTREVLSVHLMGADIEKVVEFLTRKSDQKKPDNLGGG
jgi:hypothetical protein